MGRRDVQQAYLVRSEFPRSFHLVGKALLPEELVEGLVKQVFEAGNAAFLHHVILVLKEMAIDSGSICAIV
jgi:hypothetical protein